MLLAMFALAGLASCAPPPTLPSMSKGFSTGYTVSYSTGNSAVCVSGKVPVSFSATNTKLLLNNPPDQYTASEIIAELFQNDATLPITTNGGPKAVSGTYNIAATLCYPASLDATKKVTTLQVLTHGVSLEKSYWDIASNYSYVDAAAKAGYATLAYDRLGVGGSDHPDPIQIVQAYTDVEILHGIVQLIRNAQVGSFAPKNIVGVGHSFGSIIQLAVNGKYPNDLDASVITGFAANADYLPMTVFANNPAIAKFENPSKWGSLATGYLVNNAPISVMLPFFRYPSYSPASKFSLLLQRRP